MGWIDPYVLVLQILLSGSGGGVNLSCRLESEE